MLVVKPKKLRAAITGTVVGNFMEWFDFGIYGYLAVTLSVVFTADAPEGLGLLLTLLGFAISFLARPLGGLVLGPLGDRIGRQKMLFFTMARPWSRRPIRAIGSTPAPCRWRSWSRANDAADTRRRIRTQWHT